MESWRWSSTARSLRGQVDCCHDERETPLYEVLLALIMVAVAVRVLVPVTVICLDAVQCSL